MLCLCKGTKKKHITNIEYNVPTHEFFHAFYMLQEKKVPCSNLCGMLHQTISNSHVHIFSITIEFKFSMFMNGVSSWFGKFISTMAWLT